ncbi:peptide ligase PGM1-related protein [Streptomyces misionensis]|uniref:preATP grasp domain-containing protein n=1 Tax=Streptomyces misionensis TaxID=67331 RepID=UPI0033CF2E6B
MTDQSTRKILLLNVRADFPPGIGLSDRHPIVRACWRAAWYADAGDVIASPAAFDRDFLVHVGGVLGFDTSTTSTVTRDRVLTDEVILAPDFVAELRKATACHPKWRIMACYLTEGVAELSEQLGVECEGLAFAAERGSDLLNRKGHFRQLAAGIGMPLAAGAVVQSPARLARAIERHLPDTGAVIVKQHNAGGGLGNVVLATEDLGPLPGARETRRIGQNVAEAAEKLWAELFQEQDPGLVVEVYHPVAQHMFYLEYLIDDSGAPRFLNSGTIRLVRAGTAAEPRLAWVGLELPAALPPHSLAHALTHATRFAMLAADIGYRGYLNIDAIVTASGELLFNEVNARWGGGLVLHTVASRLLGDDYANHWVASSLRDVRPMPLSAVSAAMREHSLEFTSERREGVVVLACDPTQTEALECLLIAPSVSRVRELETALRTVVEAL